MNRWAWQATDHGVARIRHNWAIKPLNLASQVALAVKNLPASARDIKNKGSIPGLERSPGGGHGNPLQYFCLENSMDRGAWWATVHRVANIQTWLKWQHTCLGQTEDLEFVNLPLHKAYLLKSFPGYTLARILKLIKDITFLDNTRLLLLKELL